MLEVTLLWEIMDPRGRRVSVTQQKHNREYQL
jgi:hypothetical protein